MNMNRIIRKHELYKAEHSWLTSYHLFSFADYYDPQNIDFWNLRVFNDDYINAKSWFGLHPHQNAEILTIVLEWEITHWDSLWNKHTTKAWEIQTLTAGTWLFHSEENLSNQDMHLFQIWFKTNAFGIKPDYKNHTIDIQKNTLNLLVSWNKQDKVWYLNTDVKVYRGQFDAWTRFHYNISEGKGLFLYIYTWSMTDEKECYEEMDQIRFSIPGNYTFTNTQKSDFILIEVNLEKV